MVIKSEDVSARVEPDVKIKARESMTKEEFDTMMKAGLDDAKAGRGMDVEDAFAKIRESI